MPVSQNRDILPKFDISVLSDEHWCRKCGQHPHERYIRYVVHMDTIEVRCGVCGYVETFLPVDAEVCYEAVL